MAKSKYPNREIEFAGVVGELKSLVFYWRRYRGPREVLSEMPQSHSGTSWEPIAFLNPGATFLNPRIVIEDSIPLREVACLGRFSFRVKDYLD